MRCEYMATKIVQASHAMNTLPTCYSNATYLYHKERNSWEQEHWDEASQTPQIQAWNGFNLGHEFWLNLWCVEDIVFFNNHRKIGRFGMEGTVKVHLFLLTLLWSGALPLHWVVQSPIQPDLEHFQLWTTHNFTGKPGLVSHHLIYAPWICLQLKTAAPCHVTRGLGKRCLCIFFIILL